MYVIHHDVVFDLNGLQDAKEHMVERANVYVASSLLVHVALGVNVAGSG